ncbi:MAG: hypothetical protein PHP42_00675 [Bacteroidota bacterium]|nr:hypothetical protein [Bacteroidota bacterium]
MTAIILLVGVTVLFMQLSAALFFVLASMSNPPLWIQQAHERGLIYVIWNSSKVNIPAKWRKFFHNTSWGVIVALFVLMLYSLDVFSGKEDFFFSVGSLADHYRNSIQVEDPVIRMTLITEDNNLRKYLENLLKMSMDLKRAGAKVVVARVPWFRMGVPKNSDQINLLSRRIDSLGYVVLACSPVIYDNKPFIPYNIQLKGYNNPDDFGMTVLSTEQSKPRFYNHPDNNIIQWYPLRQWAMGKKYYYEVDVSLIVAQKFFGINDSIKPKRIGNEVVLDWLRIPVTNKGRAYSDDYFFLTPFSRVAANRGVFGKPSKFEEDDTLRYWEDVYQPNSIYKSADERIENLDRFKKIFNGKIVVINWYNGSEQSVLPIEGINASVITGVLLQKSYTPNEQMFYLLLISLIVLIGLTVNKYGTLWSAIFTVLFTVVITFLGVWAFFSLHIIIEILYLYVAIVLSFIVFSLVKLSRMAMA